MPTWFAFLWPRDIFSFEKSSFLWCNNSFYTWWLFMMMNKGKGCKNDEIRPTWRLSLLHAEYHEESNQIPLTLSSVSYYACGLQICDAPYCILYWNTNLQRDGTGSWGLWGAISLWGWSPSRKKRALPFSSSVVMWGCMRKMTHPV